MRAVVVPQPGGPEALRIVELDDPHPGPGELLVAVGATAVNRADVMQRRGLYPPPPGTTEVLGLELAGVVAQTGSDVDGWREGDQVCAVVAGGGYAELATVPAATAMPLPPGLDVLHAAAVPEVFATAYDNVVLRGRLSQGETLLVHGGSGGVGTAAIQLARRLGARVIATAGSAGKARACEDLGADAVIDYRAREDFDRAVAELTDGRGLDVVLDVIGGPYLERNLRCLAPEGRLVVIGLMGGASATLDLGMLLARRLSVAGSVLRARPVPDKAALAADLVANVWPGFADGSLAPVIDRVLPLDRVAEAHAVMEAGEHVGKIVLQVRP